MAMVCAPTLYTCLYYFILFMAESLSAFEVTSHLFKHCLEDAIQVLCIIFTLLSELWLDHFYLGYFNFLYTVLTFVNDHLSKVGTLFSDISFLTILLVLFTFLLSKTWQHFEPSSHLLTHFIDSALWGNKFKSSLQVTTLEIGCSFIFDIFTL